MELVLTQSVKAIDLYEQYFLQYCLLRVIRWFKLLPANKMLKWAMPAQEKGVHDALKSGSYVIFSLWIKS